MCKMGEGGMKINHWLEMGQCCVCEDNPVLVAFHCKR